MKQIVEVYEEFQRSHPSLSKWLDEVAARQHLIVQRRRRISKPALHGSK
jgi:hypothetical protein